MHELQSTFWSDMQQFESVYFQHIDALYNYGTKFNANRELIEDAIQDLFADLWVKRNELDHIASIRPYLLGALRRKLLRKIYTDKEYLYDSDAMATFFEMHMLNFSDQQEDVSEEYFQQITSAFNKLTEKQKEVIYLRFYNQLSFDEIAEVMGVQKRTVYKLAYRAINLLKDQITPLSPALQLLFFWTML